MHISISGKQTRGLMDHEKRADNQAELICIATASYAGWCLTARFVVAELERAQALRISRK